MCGILQYQLIRSSRRKTIALQVTNAQIIVRAPTFVKTSYIENLVQSKLQWLAQKVAEQKHKSSSVPEFTLQFIGEKLQDTPQIYINGIPHTVDIEFGHQQVIYNSQQRRLTVVLNIRYRQLDLNSVNILAKVKSQIDRWFKAQIEDYIAQKLVILSKQVGLKPTAYKVRKYKARWGSCNSRGELSFNYLLKMVPSWVIDYVIIHELCHLKHMNHSTKFWQLVATYCPEYQLAKDWLSQHQLYLRW